jgi:hypothetical protein
LDAELIKDVTGWIFWVPLGILVVMPLISGCAHFGPASQIRPASLGKRVTVEHLLATHMEYKIFYSGSRVDPGAVLFVPLDQTDKVHLRQGWERAGGTGEVSDLISRMLERFDPDLKLWALVGHRSDDSGTEKVLAFMYSSGHASVQWSEEKERYAIHPVTDAFNPKYDTI